MKLDLSAEDVGALLDALAIADADLYDRTEDPDGIHDYEDEDVEAMREQRARLEAMYERILATARREGVHE